MFWGHILKDGKTIRLQQFLEEKEFPILHISNVCLPKTPAQGKIFLLASSGADVQNVILATLQKDKTDSYALDLYSSVTDDVTLTVQGGDVHLSGYFEPQKDEGDEGMFFGGDQDEDEDEDEEEESGIHTKNGKLNKNLK